MNQTKELVKAWAHCRHGLCPGYAQEAVSAERVETEFTFKDYAGKGSVPGVERSTVELLWHVDVDPSDPGYAQALAEAAACPHCHNPRELTDQERPVYEMSGYDPMGLVNGTVTGFNPGVQNSEADERVAALEATVAKLAALVESKG